MKFGETLQLLMEKHGIPQKQLANVLRISTTMLTNYTRCILEPDFDTLKRIAVFFEVRTDDLLDYQGAAKQERTSDGGRASAGILKHAAGTAADFSGAGQGGGAGRL